MADNTHTFVQIRKSEIQGIGLFAKGNFKKGEKVYSYPKGKVISAQKISALSDSDKRYLDKIGNDSFEIIEPPARYVNHSCEPNAAEQDRVGYALRDIKKGEEITIDYDNIAFLEKPFACRCGSKNCRGTVNGKQ